MEANDLILLQMHPCKKKQPNLILQNGGMPGMFCLTLMRDGQKGSSVLLPHQIYSETSLLCQKMKSLEAIIAIA
ncbi:hypothetical protein Tco_0313081 [Tanacetum coccineum]